MLVGLAAFLATASPAGAAFGDVFGAAPINGAPGATDTVSALAGQQHAFWAGACDRFSAPAPPPNPSDPPAPILGPGGIGGIPPRVLAPRGPNVFPVQELVAGPAVPGHCIDWGASALYATQARIWSSIPNPVQATPAGTYTPSWRLAPVRQAGAHPDGTTMFAFARNIENIGMPFGTTPGTRVDGSVDNIIVDLPPGFVGNPQAVAECSAEQFGGRPLQCPPASQVGVITLHIETANQAGTMGFWGDERNYPVFNLEPRPGRVAELGFGYASGESAVTVRLTGKARTNKDFGVTAFTGQIPAALTPTVQSITLWGVPWATHNDLWRPLQGHQPQKGHPVDAPCNLQPGVTSVPPPEFYIPPGGMPTPACRASYDPSWGDTPAERTIRPFLSNETDCNSAPTVRLAMDAFQRPGAFTADRDPVEGDSNWKRYDSVSPSVTGCEGLAFDPDLEFDPTSSEADGASGLGVDLAVPQNNEPRDGDGVALVPPVPGASEAEIDDYVAAATAYFASEEGRATAHLKDTVVELPSGVSVNPSGATGLEGCSDSQVGLRELGDPPRFNNGDPFDKDGGADGAECPDGSKIGTASVDTPLLAAPLTGEVILGEPKSTNPQSGEMFRLFLVLRDEERGLVAKVFGSTKADPQTGRLTARFAGNPEIPFDNLHLDIKGGQRGLLALPQRCQGSHDWSAALTPWSSVGAPVAVPDATDGGAFAVDQACGNAFAPTLTAGMNTQKARANGTFSFRFTRPQGEQWLRGLTAKLPTGLLASVKGLPLCTDAQANAGTCPAGSKIGIVDAAAGSGDPFVLEEKGEIFLTEGYKGGAYGLAVKVRAIAGPFRGAMELSPIIVRQAVHVDRKTAQVTAVSDPFPQVWHGVPLRVREVTVLVNRDKFMLNPSDCEAKTVQAAITSTEGTVANLSNPFQTTGCANLPFKPKLALRLTGRKQVRTGKHPGIKAKVTQTGIGEAGIQKAVVRLPKSLALDPDNAQALCEFEDGTKDDIERHCPKGSIVGRARATSPLLNDPLVGNVYFVKNIRTDAKTGNQIRTLPMIMVALRGEIAINLKGESNTTKDGKLVNTFDNVPDAPVSQFNLNINGGMRGILAVTRTRRARINLCAGRHVAEADMDGHNGRRHDRDIRMKTPCTKRQTKAAKRKAKRAAAKAKR